jgi:hypothetical protein
MKNLRNFSQLGETLLVIYCQKEFNCKNPDPSFFRKNKDEGVNEIILNKGNQYFGFFDEIESPEEELLFWSIELGITKVLPSEGRFNFIGSVDGQITATQVAKATHLIHKRKHDSIFIYDIFRFPTRQRESIIIFSSLSYEEAQPKAVIE